jgi:hypothetical protein
MSDFKEPRDAFVDDVRAGMPPLAEPDALDRVRTRALASPGAARSHRVSSRAWRIAGTVAAAAAVLVVAALVLAPRLETAAFAREQAADALLLKSDGSVLHSVVRYRSTGWNEQYGTTRATTVTNDGRPGSIRSASASVTRLSMWAMDPSTA